MDGRAGVRWALSEFEGIQFGDRRVEDRFIFTIGKMAEKPSVSLPQVFSNSKDLKGTYRLFENPAFEVEELLDCHTERSVERISYEQNAFVIQDITFLDYDGHKKTAGLGSIGRRRGDATQGLILHSALSLSERGTPLGFLDLKCWARKEDKHRISRGKRRKINKSLPIESKESINWINVLKRTADLAPNAITLADRESDIIEFLCCASEANARYVIRGNYDRRIVSDEATHMRALLKETPFSGTFTIDISPRQGVKARQAHVEMRFREVTICPPRKLKSAISSTVKVTPITVSIVEVKEPSPPSGVQAIDWLLITSEKVTSFADALKIVSWYKLRWHIEVFHKVLKSGCAVEECAFSSKEKLIKYIVVKSIIAFRIMYLTQVSREKPDSLCTDILQTNEWKALYCAKFKVNQPPDHPPTLKEAAIWIAELGGYLNRKNDLPPGPIVIWRGWQVLAHYIDFWNVMSKEGL
jgi:hypothetical protein